MRGDFTNELITNYLSTGMGICVDFTKRQSFVPNLILTCFIPGTLRVLGSTKIWAPSSLTV